MIRFDCPLPTQNGANSEKKIKGQNVKRKALQLYICNNNNRQNKAKFGPLIGVTTELETVKP